jgi:glutathione synthase/RimK-type ligase-like ATP-grasp enzyme
MNDFSHSPTPENPFGPPLKTGEDLVSVKDWQQIKDFIESRAWYFDEPCLPEDGSDPLTKNRLPYGAFMLGFDFHLTSQGPRLIEINTNAGGLASALYLHREDSSGRDIALSFVSALTLEFRAFGGVESPGLIAIMDDDVEKQHFFPEMKSLGQLLQKAGIKTVVISPEDAIPSPEGLQFHGETIEVIYNRLVDFRLKEASHNHLRQAAIEKKVLITPHPAAYARIADKRNLLRLRHPLNPRSFQLRDKPLDEWWQNRKHWVFKPPQGAGSRGVYRGDKITSVKFNTLPLETVVQEYVHVPKSEDGSKYDVRVYTQDHHILAAVARHYTGQVMEMRSALAGFRRIKIK